MSEVPLPNAEPKAVLIPPRTGFEASEGAWMRVATHPG